MSPYGGCSSVGRAPDCGSGCRGYKSHHPPHLRAFAKATALRRGKPTSLLDDFPNWLARRWLRRSPEGTKSSSTTHLTALRRSKPAILSNFPLKSPIIIIGDSNAHRLHSQKHKKSEPTLRRCLQQSESANCGTQFRRMQNNLDRRSLEVRDCHLLQRRSEGECLRAIPEDWVWSSFLNASLVI